MSLSPYHVKHLAMKLRGAKSSAIEKLIPALASAILRFCCIIRLLMKVLMI